MAQRPQLGSKLHRLRRERGLTQAELARRLSISASYLNLIEHNQRALTAPLLLKVSELLGADLESFSGRGDAKILGELTEMASDPLFQDVIIGDDDLADLVTNAPAACDIMLRAYNACLQAQGQVRVLADQLSENPFVEDSTHQLRTLLTSIRSLAEIVRDNADLSAEEQRTFLGIVASESEILSGVVDRFYEFIDEVGSEGAREEESSLEDVNAYLETHENHFEDLEALAEEIGKHLDLQPHNRLPRLIDHLSQAHDIEVHRTIPTGPNGDGLHFDAQSREARISLLLPLRSAAFLLARLLSRVSHDGVLEALIDAGNLGSGAGRQLCKAALERYFAGALLMPYAAFHEAALEARYDIATLQRRFDVSFEQACHRLTTLNRKGARGVHQHFVRVDIAGNTSKVYRGSGLRIPRQGGICPLWNVHTAFTRPNEVIRQIIELPDGETYFCLAGAYDRFGQEYAVVRSRYAIGLGCRLSDAPSLVYADGLDLEERRLRLPVGTTCRLCERWDCPQRAQPSILRRRSEADAANEAAN